MEVAGWREWVSLPDHGVPFIKAKLDTGARTSSLHAHAIELERRDGRRLARFDVHPWQRSARDAVRVEAPVVDERTVRSSNGETERRIVVTMTVGLGGLLLPCEVTITNRDAMGFRMLIGRQALRGRVLVDPARSYTAGRPPRDIRLRNRRSGSNGTR